MLALWFGHFENWELYDKVTFDGPNKLITVNPGVTSIDIKADVYSAWKRWVQAGGNSRFSAALRGIGGDPTVTGQKAGDIYFLINGWKLQIDFAVTGVTGILFSDDFSTAYWDENGNPLTPALVSSTVNTIQTTTPVVTGDLASVPAAVWNYVQ